MHNGFKHTVQAFGPSQDVSRSNSALFLLEQQSAAAASKAAEHDGPVSVLTSASRFTGCENGISTRARAVLETGEMIERGGTLVLLAKQQPRSLIWCENDSARGRLTFVEHDASIGNSNGCGSRGFPSMHNEYREIRGLKIDIGIRLLCSNVIWLQFTIMKMAKQIVKMVVLLTW